MSTNAQIAANRRNAGLSTGPATAAGKATSARNATSHGLAGSAAVLAHEDSAEFARLLATYQAEFEPQTEHERFLVEQMADARWRLARIRRLEAIVYRMMIYNVVPQTPDERIAARFREDPAALSRLERYATAAERSYYKAHREMTASAAARQTAASTAKAAEAAELDAALERFVNAPPPTAMLNLQNEPNFVPPAASAPRAGKEPDASPAPVLVRTSAA